MDCNSKVGRAVPCAPLPPMLTTVCGAQGTARPTPEALSMPATAQ